MNQENAELLILVGAHLASGKLLHLASQSNRVLWMCHVWYAVGDRINELVFTSNRTRRHSQEIERDPVIAGGIVPIQLEGLGQKVQGMAFEGTVIEATGSDLERVYELYAIRWPTVRQMFTASAVRSGATDMRLYSVNISRLVLFDEVNFPSSARQEIRF